jgi:hypothetical protein
VSGDAGLEHGYRRLLACYPSRFRDERGEELLAVLMTGARDGQHRPGLIETADLVRSGLGMRLRPDTSRSARRRWSDALAIYSLIGPVILLLTTVTSTLLSATVNPHPVAILTAVWPGMCVTLASNAVIVALVTAGWRKTALAALVLVAAILWLATFRISVLEMGAGSDLVSNMGVYVLEAAALIASPGPRQGRRLVHWGHWAFLLPATAAVQVCMFLSLSWRSSLAALGVMVIGIVAFNRLGRVLRLSRFFRLLLAAGFWPVIIETALWNLGGSQLTDNIGIIPVVAAMFAGPVLCAAAAMAALTRLNPARGAR